jgi:hypothetical protein
LSLAAPAVAQTSTTSDPNAAICAGLLAEAPGGVSGDHTKLCACLVRETPKQLTQADMLAYAQASAESKAPPDAVMAKVMAVATQCLQEAQ